MKEEEGRRIATVDTFNVAEKRIQELNNKLTKADKDKKNAKATREGVKRQAESQCKQLCQTEDQLSIARKQIRVLKKKREDVKKARDQAEQDGYEWGS